MKNFLKWLLMYSLFGLSSAFIVHAAETRGEMVSDWWLALLFVGGL
ncbi:hypothetical protein [Paraglaciecola marina]|nr:hypothetical protein [Paraglaciecola marina]